ncbi:hypothetical protein BKA66DRAFT_424436 [Pyrenochaeta sp. MPI-SDFR-AT-0127]|nr:hypothetical protein BKA66DRAFT_424436 [Pyrenochaeta sp. MPI-SDFR-AT-0127]
MLLPYNLLIVFSLIHALHVSLLHAATLLAGGTVIGWDADAHDLNVIRNASILIEHDTISAVFSDAYDGTLPPDLETIDASYDIISTGFIDTHRHSWQTAFKTLGSNTTLLEYFSRYGTPSPASTIFTPEDVYIGELIGLYEALNGGVTTIVDYAHCTWSAAHSRAALNAAYDSGARMTWAYNFGNYSQTNFTFEEQVELFKNIAEDTKPAESVVELGISYDGFSGTNLSQSQVVLDLAKEYNVSLVTTHANGGVYGAPNFPEVLQTFNFLNQTIPIIFAHASYLSVIGAQLLRQFNQYISITPESEMHYGHDHPTSHLVLDQASLGIDTHFTYSSDILTQARMWLQSVRQTFYREVIQRRSVPARNPMSVNQAFLLATRNGGLALRRHDLGILAPGAKADLVVWDGRSPSLLGWSDPVAAIMLHASIGDIRHVMVNGKFSKRDGKLTTPGYGELQGRFLKSARRIQEAWKHFPAPILEGVTFSGIPYEQPVEADVRRGDGTGYGRLFV